jgi:hypothetical protein
MSTRSLVVMMMQQVDCSPTKLGDPLDSIVSIAQHPLARRADATGDHYVVPKTISSKMGFVKDWLSRRYLLPPYSGASRRIEFGPNKPCLAPRR